MEQNQELRAKETARGYDIIIKTCKEYTLKVVNWVDENGRKRRSLIKDTDGLEMARYGIPAEPPDITNCLDWTDIQNAVQDVLIDQELLTWADVQRNQAGLQAAINVFKRALISLYRAQENELKPGGKTNG